MSNFAQTVSVNWLYRAISFSPIQNERSGLKLVLWPATTIVRLTTADSIGFVCPKSDMAAVRHRFSAGIAGVDLNILAFFGETTSRRRCLIAAPAAIIGSGCIVAAKIPCYYVRRNLH